MNNMYSIYSGRRVLITGHTGFKGAWLTSWLLKMGAEVIGYSDCIPTQPAMFEVLDLESRIEHHIGDIRDFEHIKKVINDTKPDFIFHLAAQPIVSASYADPLNTISTNVIGTANVLEALRILNPECVAVIITSDKCYENVEWVWGYKETDHLGGKDIYSGSKGAAEVIFHAYYNSFFVGNKASRVKLATGRAGNVIGGGDWAMDRIVADCMRSWSKGHPVEIRCPSATRPWQHVLEPLSGYLLLGADLYSCKQSYGESYNFGPKSEQNRTVVDLLNDLSQRWDFGANGSAYNITENIPFHEAGLLKLNCDKAIFNLKWEANLYYKECVELVKNWYYEYYNKDQGKMYELTMQQIAEYESLALERKLVWTK